MSIDEGGVKVGIVLFTDAKQFLSRVWGVAAGREKEKNKGSRRDIRLLLTTTCPSIHHKLVNVTMEKRQVVSPARPGPSRSSHSPPIDGCRCSWGVVVCFRWWCQEIVYALKQCDVSMRMGRRS